MLNAREASQRLPFKIKSERGSQEVIGPRRHNTLVRRVLSLCKEGAEILPPLRSVRMTEKGGIRMFFYVRVAQHAVAL